MISTETAIALAELGVEATKAVIGAKQKATSPTDFARRLLGIGTQLVPVAELRAHLDAIDAEQAEAVADIAEEAKLAAKALGGGQ